MRRKRASMAMTASDERSTPKDEKDVGLHFIGFVLISEQDCLDVASGSRFNLSPSFSVKLLLLRLKNGPETGYRSQTLCQWGSIGQWSLAIIFVPWRNSLSRRFLSRRSWVHSQPLPNAFLPLEYKVMGT